MSYQPGVSMIAELVADAVRSLGYGVRLVRKPSRRSPLAVVTPYGVFYDPFEALSVLMRERPGEGEGVVG